MLNNKIDTIDRVHIKYASFGNLILCRHYRLSFDFKHEILHIKVEGYGRNADREDYVSVLRVEGHGRKDA